MKKILVIIGSAAKTSSNHSLIDHLAHLTRQSLQFQVFDGLKTLPHFDPELSLEDTPAEVLAFRKMVEEADGVLISTPEYVFSIPSGLKNAIEWCVSVTVFSDKPLGIITASAHGEKGHEELQLIMRTLMARFNPGTTLLIQGIKGKTDEFKKIKDEETLANLSRFADAYIRLLNQAVH